MDAVLGWCVIDAGSGRPFDGQQGDRVFRTASIGKVLLLLEVAEQFRTGRLDPKAPLARSAADFVADSGLWQFLRADALPAADLAVLVGAVSDNLATNVLLRSVGLQSVAAGADRLGLRFTRLHDRVRDHREPDDPTTLSTGTPAELAWLMSALHTGQGAHPEVCATVLDWLRAGTDLSMVAAAFGLDPLAHHGADRGLRLTHKTGTDTGIRAETGLLTGPYRSVAYAVLAEFDDADRDTVLASMRGIGDRIRRWASGQDGGDTGSS